MRARIFLMAVTLLGGCTVGPNYVVPHPSVPERFQEGDATGTEAPLSQPQSQIADLSRWWTLIDDPELQKLISQALAANLDLRSAATRIRVAREQEIIAGAAGLPQVNASGTAAHIHSNTSLPSGGSGSGDSTDLSIYSAGFDATWEVDVFGGVRRSVEAARASAEAAVWEMRDGEVSLTAEVANAYMALRATQVRIALLTTEYSDEQQTLSLVEARARTGFVTQLDVNQSKTLAATTAAEIPDLEAQARVHEHAIAVLAAMEPEALVVELDKSAPLPAVPATLPTGLPSDLLRRRPDIREAERKLAAATAEEGIAIAGLYPRFNLLGLLSFTSNDIGGLFSTNSLSEIGGGQVTWPIFNGGKIHANIRTKKAQTEQAYYAYQKAVLNAVQDSEDALVRYKKEQLRLRNLESAVEASRSSEQIALQQYKVGLVTYVNVLTAQSQHRQAQSDLVQSRQAFAQDLISLYKALGGGWAENAS